MIKTVTQSVKRSWYLVLEKIVKVPGTKGALTKMVLDQGIITVDMVKRLTAFIKECLLLPSFASLLPLPPLCKACLCRYEIRK